MEILFVKLFGILISLFPFLFTSIKSTRQEAQKKTLKLESKKARVAFLMPSQIWKSKLMKLKTNTRIFNSSVESVLLYSSETWRITKHTVNKIQNMPPENHECEMVRQSQQQHFVDQD